MYLKSIGLVGLSSGLEKVLCDINLRGVILVAQNDKHFLRHYDFYKIMLLLCRHIIVDLPKQRIEKRKCDHQF